MIAEICRVMAATGSLSCGQPMQALDAIALWRSMPQEPITDEVGQIVASGPFVRPLPPPK